jgi:hypothetical protein
VFELDVGGDGEGGADGVEDGGVFRVLADYDRNRTNRSGYHGMAPTDILITDRLPISHVEPD